MRPFLQTYTVCMAIPDLLAPIDLAADGPEVVAFFDMDGTVLAGFTAFVFAQERMKSPELADLGVAATAVRYQLGLATFEDLIRTSAAALAGTLTEEVDALATGLFRSTIGGLIYPEVRDLMLAHRRKGHRVVMLSAATTMQVAPVAADLGIDEVLCNQMEVVDGRLTGVVLDPIIYGEGKATAASSFASAAGLDLANAFFYTDGVEDLPLLEQVGHPQPLNPDKRLMRVAAQKGWTAATFDSRGRPTRSQVARTILAQASVLPAVTAGLIVGAVNRDRRQAVNLMMSAWGDLSVALAGASLEVNGEQHLWSHRPAVFTFNHQSNFDGILLMKLLRRDITAVAKEQLRHMPLVGPIFSFGDVIFIDRADHDGAVRKMAEAAERIKSGLSVVIAPEGTRQPSPRLGPFKKGAFHLAIEAGVPIVPIVIHNSLDVLPRGGRVMRRATVKIDVLPPVPVDGWSTETLENHIHSVRQLYLDTLGQA